MINGVFSMKNRIKREFVLLVCVIGTVTLLKFGPFPSKFPKGTGLLRIQIFMGFASFETLEGDAARSSGE
jgi:hypothetical protein